MKHIFPLIFTFIIALSCSEDEQITFFYNPTVEVQFFNIDSLIKVTDSITIVEDSIAVLTDTLTYWNDSIIVLTDTIIKLTILINDGQLELTDEKLLFEDYLDLFNGNVIDHNKIDSVLDVKNASLGAVKSDIESGLMLLTSIQNAQNGNTKTYDDSTELYYFPMDMKSDSTSYVLEITGASYDLVLDYQRVNEVDEKSRIIVSAFDITTKRHSFDSVKVFCKTDLCENESVSIQIYF